jgi:transcriptional regulator with XRE-family HTH domain
MGMNFREFVRLVRRQKNIPVKEICAALDVSLTTFHRLEDGRLAHPHPHLLMEYSKVLGVDYLYLMQLCEYINSNDINEAHSAQKIPHFPWSVLPGLETMDVEHLTRISKEFELTDLKEAGLFLVTVDDDFWAPDIRKGDKITLQKTLHFKDKDMVVMSAKKPFPLTFKRVRKFAKKLFLQSVSVLDQTQEEEWSAVLEPRIIGKVVEVKRRF